MNNINNNNDNYEILLELIDKGTHHRLAQAQQQEKVCNLLDLTGFLN